MDIHKLLNPEPVPAIVLTDNIKYSLQKILICNQCGMSYSRPYNLKIHKMIKHSI